LGTLMTKNGRSAPYPSGHDGWGSEMRVLRHKLSPSRFAMVEMQRQGFNLIDGQDVENAQTLRGWWKPLFLQDIARRDGA
jgi:hypothetical protein